MFSRFVLKSLSCNIADTVSLLASLQLRGISYDSSTWNVWRNVSVSSCLSHNSTPKSAARSLPHCRSLEFRFIALSAIHRISPPRSYLLYRIPRWLRFMHALCISSPTTQCLFLNSNLRRPCLLLRIYYVRNLCICLTIYNETIYFDIVPGSIAFRCTLLPKRERNETRRASRDIFHR
jgi:hypothetical protein